MQPRLIALIAAAVLAAVPARAAEPGLREYAPETLRRLDPGLNPDAPGVELRQVLPCLDSTDRPVCLLKLVAATEAAARTRWDLRLWPRAEFIRVSGLHEASARWAGDPEAAVAKAIWDSVALLRTGSEPRRALAPVGGLRAGALGEETTFALRLKAYRLIVTPPPGLSARTRQDLARLAPEALAAWKAEYVRANPRTRRQYREAAQLSGALLAAGDVLGAQQVERLSGWSRNNPYAALGLTIGAHLAAGRVDEAWAALDGARPARVDADRDVLRMHRMRVLEAAEAGDRPDIARAIGHAAVADGFPHNGSAPRVEDMELAIPVLLQHDRVAARELADRLAAMSGPRPGGITPPPALAFARELYRGLGEDARATALFEPWLPVLRDAREEPRALDALQRLLLEEGRLDEALALETASTAQVLGEAAALLGADDARLAAVLASESAERRTAAWYACGRNAHARGEMAAARACLDRFDPAAAPSLVALDVGRLALSQAAAEWESGDHAPWLTIAARCLKDVAKRDPRLLVFARIDPDRLADLAFAALNAD